MKNTDVFNEYDMVVSMTQKTINDQLTHLLKMGVIRGEFIVTQDTDDNDNFVYKVLDSSDQIPDSVAYIDGMIKPSVNISESGENITFILNFLSGTAAFWQGYGHKAKLVENDMTNWTYGVAITLDLKAVEKDDIGKKIKVPQLVQDQLYHFKDSMFTVNSLFMDFESTDLLRFDPAHTSTPTTSDLGQKQFVEFMEFYLKDLLKKGNPYILGYSLDSTDQSKYTDNQNVPDSLKPVGTTFSLYHDPVNADLSNLNFVLATKGGHGKIAGTPGTFDTNWISTTEQCDAKMIYSHEVLIEKFFLKPMFDQMRDQVYAQIKDSISVDAGNTYDRAKQVTATGIKYDISNVTTGDDQYVNSYTVTIENKTTQTNLNFDGNLSLYKEVNKNMGFCTAEAHTSGKVHWTGQISIITSKDAQGNPTLTLTKGFNVDKPDTDSDKNKCAEAFEWIGKIIGTILDLFTGFFDGGLFTKLLDSVMDLKVPGIGNVGVVFGNLGNAVQTAVMLPAGQVFFFKNPATDPNGNFYLELTYKAEN